MFAADLNRRLEDQPFRPFRIHLSDGTSVDVIEPRMVIVGTTSAVLPTKWTTDVNGRRVAQDWRTIILVHMVQFSDLNGSRSGGRGRRKPHG